MSNAGNRIDDLTAALERLQDVGEPASPRLGQTKADPGPYPTEASAWYAMDGVSVSGIEEEGEPAAFEGNGVTFLAYNLGDAIPEVGEVFLCTPVDGRYVFVAREAPE